MATPASVLAASNVLWRKKNQVEKNRLTLDAARWVWPSFSDRHLKGGDRGRMARHCVPLGVSENRTAKRLAKGLAALECARPKKKKCIGKHRDARRDSGLSIKADRSPEYWEACYEREGEREKRVAAGLSIGAGLQCSCLWLQSRRLFPPIPPPLKGRKKKGNHEKKMTTRLRRMNSGESLHSPGW